MASAANDCEHAPSSPIVTFGRVGGACGCGAVTGWVAGTSASSAARMLTGSGASADCSTTVPSSPFAATRSRATVTVAFASAPCTTKVRPALGIAAPVGMSSVNAPVSVVSVVCTGPVTPTAAGSNCTWRFAPAVPSGCASKPTTTAGSGAAASTPPISATLSLICCMPR